jgi:hypothetical protein
LSYCPNEKGQWNNDLEITKQNYKIEYHEPATNSPSEPRSPGRVICSFSTNDTRCVTVWLINKGIITWCFSYIECKYTFYDCRFSSCFIEYYMHIVSKLTKYLNKWNVHEYIFTKQIYNNNIIYVIKVYPVVPKALIYGFWLPPRYLQILLLCFINVIFIYLRCAFSTNDTRCVTVEWHEHHLICKSCRTPYYVNKYK